MMHSGKEKMKLVGSLEVLNIEDGVWKQEKIHGDKPPLGIRDCSLALLKCARTNRLRPFVFGGFCGHSSCMHNSLHELCYDPEQERYEWNETAANNDAPGQPLKKRNAAAAAYVTDGIEQVCVFAGRGLANAAPHQQSTAEYIHLHMWYDEPCGTNELHFLNLDQGWLTSTFTITYVALLKIFLVVATLRINQPLRIFL